MNSGSKLCSLPSARVLGVVSDTHGNVENTQRAVRMLESCEVDAVIHCGDIGSLQIPAFFQLWPTYYVLGNVDWQRDLLMAAITESGGTFCGRFGSLATQHRKIAWLHGDDAKRLAAESESGQWDLVCHGHTHKARQNRQDTTLVLNPGALHRAHPPSLAIVQLEQMQAHIVNLE